MHLTEGPPEQAVNPNTGRAVVQAIFGVACYEMTSITEGHRVGLVRDADDANRWLDGFNADDIESFLRLPTDEPSR